MELTTVFSILVKADVDAFNLQMFFSILQESSETRGRTEEDFHLMRTRAQVKFIVCKCQNIWRTWIRSGLTSLYCLQAAGHEASQQKVRCSLGQHPTGLFLSWWDGFGSGVSLGDHSLQVLLLQSTFDPGNINPCHYLQLCLRFCSSGCGFNVLNVSFGDSLKRAAEL